jgi:hypothetical protein
MAAVTREREVDTNFEAFQKLLPELLESQPGKFAVMHQGKVAEFFDTVADAVRYGRATFGDTFSIQEVTRRSVNLGYHSYALQHVSN